MEELLENPKKRRRSRPAMTPEARENQLINKAVNLAEKKLDDGTASSQIIALLLGLATQKSRLEIEKLRSDLRVADAKIQAMANAESSKDLYEKAIKAFRSYSGQEEENYDDEEY